MLRTFFVGLIMVGLAFAQDDPVVLRVQSTNYTQSDFDDRFNFYVANLANQQGVPLNDESRAMFEEMRPDYTEQLITETAVRNIGTSLGLGVEDTFVDEQVEALKTNFDSEEAFLSAMSDAGIKDEAFLRSLVRESELSRRTVATLQEDIELKDYQVEIFYNANRASLEQPAQTCARHILVETLEEAQALEAQLEAGGSFEELAAEASIDPGSAARGGDLGCFGPGRMVPQFEEAAFNTPIGTVSKPTESDFGYHLVLPYERQQASLVPLEEVEGEIREELKRQIVRRALEGYVEGADVERF